MRDLDAALLVVLCAIATLGTCSDCAAPARAQSRPVSARLAAGGAPDVSRGTDADVLTRALIAEADASSADYAPILSALQARADRVGSTPARLAVRYCRLFRSRHPTPRMAEILALPGVMPRPRVEMWARARGVVERWLAGDHRSACVEVPAHFGDRTGDAAQALRMAWREVDCGATANGFWRER